MNRNMREKSRTSAVSRLTPDLKVEVGDGKTKTEAPE